MIPPHTVERVLDVRGLLCPLPLIRARQALEPGVTLIVLATDPEAQIDLAALAADEGRRFTQSEAEGVWRLVLAAQQ
jgi:tRNA 2-thiouridine synthesizing protein A